ncbi:hypothetical protein ABEG18_11135 [Alsobacter sp. KACC 23698]|uniref:Uncharacterized protein n=1 Tax=Alsobacter sp. KACC 23698 TaxID=3149229 RepID=A0AAU7JMH6_9HYPH
MPDLIDAMQDEAQAAIAAMKEAAIAARAVHARAELLRHMRTTARKVAGRDRDEAVAFVVGEWMNAWALAPEDAPDLAADMRRFTAAICAHGEGPDDATDTEMRAAFAGLEAACARAGVSLSDQMAWRSECAHGWWEAVSPVPPDLPGRKPRPGVPASRAGEPFWTAGAAPHCMG